MIRENNKLEWQTILNAYLTRLFTVIIVTCISFGLLLLIIGLGISQPIVQRMFFVLSGVSLILIVRFYRNPSAIIRVIFNLTASLYLLMGIIDIFSGVVQTGLIQVTTGACVSFLGFYVAANMTESWEENWHRIFSHNSKKTEESQSKNIITPDYDRSKSHTILDFSSELERAEYVFKSLFWQYYLNASKELQNAWNAYSITEQASIIVQKYSSIGSSNFSKNPQNWLEEREWITKETMSNAEEFCKETVRIMALPSDAKWSVDTAANIARRRFESVMNSHLANKYLPLELENSWLMWRKEIEELQNSNKNPLISLAEQKTTHLTADDFGVLKRVPIISVKKAA